MALQRHNFSMLSHVGRVRQGNEDTCAALPEHGVFVVCDGMGGAAAGEVASALAAKTFLAAVLSMPKNAAAVRLTRAVAVANQAVYEESVRDRAMKGMGTTLVALLLADSDPVSSFTLAHVGDSRCYRFRAGELTQMTTDHSFVEEQVRLGEITAAQAAVHPMRNIITRVVGTGETVEPDILHYAAQPGDLYLLASDGLTRDLTAEDVVRTLTRAASSGAGLDLDGLCWTLVDEANQAGGGDNVTVLLVQIP